MSAASRIGLFSKGGQSLSGEEVDQLDLQQLSQIISRVSAHTHTHAYAHTRTHAYTHARTHTHIHTRTHTLSLPRTHSLSHAHARAHTHAHTRTVMFQSGVAVTDGVPGSALCPQISVFYRASPRHKLKIVKVSRQEVQFMKQEKLNKRDRFEARTAF